MKPASLKAKYYLVLLQAVIELAWFVKGIINGYLLFDVDSEGEAQERHSSKRAAPPAWLGARRCNPVSEILAARFRQWNSPIRKIASSGLLGQPPAFRPVMLLCREACSVD